MRLKAIEIFGFKSFPERTVIEFDQGVTCIVGPNGCGKSNITDAIRWVLGERSAKLLRGATMEDVIFNGTDFRKPLNMAEVSLTIDNSDRGLPIDYQEVTITRRLYRTGESEYLINKTICRLRDIQDLILDTGMGSNSYSMMEQGRIDYILNADPEEKRALIEEAAGISKYKAKKEEAIRKLERTEENLLRLKDVIHEVARNIQYAERQARRAERYKEQFEKLKSLEITRAFCDLRQLHDERDKLGLQQRQLEEARDQTAEAAQEAESRYQALREDLRDISARYSQEELNRYDLRSRWTQTKQQIHFNQEKNLSLANQRGQIEQEIQTLSTQVEKGAHEIHRKKEEIQELEGEKERARAELENFEHQLNDVEKKLNETKRRLEETRNQVFQTASELAQVRNELHRRQAFLENTRLQIEKQEGQARRFETESTNWSEKRRAYASDIVALESQMAVMTQRRQELLQMIEQLKAALEEEKTATSQLESALREKQARYKALQEINLVQVRSNTLLGEGSGIDLEGITSLTDLLHVEAGYEHAVQAFLGAYLPTWILRDTDQCASLLERIRQSGVSPLTLLIQHPAGPLSQSPPSSPTEPLPEHPLISGPLSEKLSAPDPYRETLALLFHNTYVLERLDADSLAELLPLARTCVLVTRDGWCLGPGPRLFWAGPQSSSETNCFQRKAELERLESRLAFDYAVLDEARRRSCALARSLEKKQQQISSCETELTNLRIQRESLESFIKGVAERLAAHQKELQLLEYERHEMLSQCEGALREKQVFEERLAVLETEERNIYQLQEGLMRQLENLEGERHKLVSTTSQKRAFYESLSERYVLLQDTLSLMVQHDQRDRSRLETLEKELSRVNQEGCELRQSDEHLLQTQTELEEASRQSEIALDRIRQEKERKEEETSRVHSELEAILARKQEYHDQLHQLEMKTLDWGYREKAIYERLAQTYHLQLEEFNPADYPLVHDSMEALVAEIETLRQKVENLGTVNLLAIEEYDELKQRYDFLLGQQKDLEDSRQALLDAIRKINRTTKGLFEETLAKVQASFQQYYEILFRGGEARLTLLDEANPLESGIDIFVRPSGKRLQHLSLLSGGEKALTAIALLFALFKIKPSPFCVLDEVDAPLDEANIDRFLTVLRTFLESSQFIIVTHNRKTIAMGDSLYGVTMEEAGVSKIVSVRVTSDSTLEAPAEDSVKDEITA